MVNAVCGRNCVSLNLIDCRYVFPSPSGFRPSFAKRSARYAAALSPPGCAVPRPCMSSAASALTVSLIVATLMLSSRYCSVADRARAGAGALCASPNVVEVTSRIVSSNARYLLRRIIESFTYLYSLILVFGCDGHYCRGGTPWPPQFARIMPPSSEWGGHGVPPLQ